MWLTCTPIGLRACGCSRSETLLCLLCPSRIQNRGHIHTGLGSMTSSAGVDGAYLSFLFTPLSHSLPFSSLTHSLSPHLFTLLSPNPQSLHLTLSLSLMLLFLYFPLNGYVSF
ncbi:hypothetical protein J4Q44_G00195770 [Coregonus suidteri]|uniref:Uncharacterized protein n=1 Tax=Coregonus suidteri TaxID=861788 RepID=A0AAN8QSL8_9TELE